MIKADIKVHLTLRNEVNIWEKEQYEMENGTLYYSKTLKKWVFQYYVGATRKTIKQKNNETKKEFNIRFIFYDRKNNKFINPQAVNSYLKRLNSKYKIAPNLHTHMLRHTLATRMVEADVNPKVAQKILGHKRISTTLDIYTSVGEEFKKEETEKYNEYMQKNAYKIGYCIPTSYFKKIRHVKS